MAIGVYSTGSYGSILYRIFLSVCDVWPYFAFILLILQRRLKLKILREQLF